MTPFINNSILKLFLLSLLLVPSVFASPASNVTARGEYGNSQTVFATTGKGRVAFMGGSITEMNGYRPMVCDFLRQKFPNTEFEFIAAGISSTCSDTGAFRLSSDVLAAGKIDLFFLEFAVNDNQDGFFSESHSLRGFEGIVRHIRTEFPDVDIVVTFFANEPLMESYRQGQVPASIQAHTRVAERYGISTVNMAKEVQERIDAGTLTWNQYGGVHPAPAGNQICADLIAELLTNFWKNSASGIKPHMMPEQIDRFSYVNGHFRGFENIQPGDFTLSVPDWKSIPGGLRERFAGQKMLCATTPGATCTFDFEGPVLGLYILAGPDAGQIEFSIDGGEFQKIELYHAYSSGLHYPRTVVLADELTAEKHSVTLRVSQEKAAQSTGHAVRILQICE